MRILHLHFGKDGGAERFFVKLAGALDRRGIEQAAFIRPNRPWRQNLPATLWIEEGVPRTLNLPWLAWRRNRLIRKFKPDGIVAWMPRAAAFLPPTSNIKRITRLGDYPQSLKPFGRTDVIVCNTPGISAHVRELGWLREAEVISNFSPTPVTTPIPRTQLEVPPDALLVVGVGRLVPRKGFDGLIRAIASLKNAYLLLVGDGGEEANLRALASALGVADRVRFLGWCDNPAPFIASADIFALPSIHEPLGNGILEAWALGVPVVAAASEGPSWVINHGVDGLLHRPGDAAALASALSRLRDNPALRTQIGSAGTSSLAARFSEEAICKHYLSLFSSSL